MINFISDYNSEDFFKGEVLVNPVNCVGVMGRGLALEFKQRYPAMFKSYKEECDLKHIKIGKVWLFGENPIIVCFPTKLHWRDPSKIEWIEQGLIDLRQQILAYGIQSINLPMLGCGLGGLNEVEVSCLVTKHLDLDIEVNLFMGIKK